MMAVQARLGPPRPEQRDKCLPRAGLACLGQGWSVLRGAGGGGAETPSRLRQPLRAPGAHAAGQKERRPALVLEFSVHLAGASWNKGRETGRACHAWQSTHTHTCCCGDPGTLRVPSALPPRCRARNGGPQGWALPWQVGTNVGTCSLTRCHKGMARSQTCIALLGLKGGLCAGTLKNSLSCSRHRVWTLCEADETFKDPQEWRHSAPGLCEGGNLRHSPTPRGPGSCP